MSDGVPPMDEPLQGVLANWASTLTEPLLHPKLRNRLEGNLARAHREHPDRVHLFLAGVTSDAILSLPSADRWRHLSGRVGAITVGEDPPEDDGATGSNGSPFGTWRDAVDVAGFSDDAVTPWDDQNLIALTEPPHPHSMAILAAGAVGYRAAARLIRQVQAVGDAPPPPLEGVEEMPFLNNPDYLALHALTHARTCAVEAVRWAIHRRRSYTGPNDPWLVDGIATWAWRASRGASHEPEREWSDADVERDIEAWRIRRAEDDPFRRLPRRG